MKIEIKIIGDTNDNEFKKKIDALFGRDTKEAELALVQPEEAQAEEDYIDVAWFRKRAIDYAKTHGNAAMKAILTELGAEKLSDLGQEQMEKALEMMGVAHA